MTTVSTVGTESVDGRKARRDRNREAVLDAVIELFSDGNLRPTPDEVARRSGVSLRSVYRYVEDSTDLIRAAIDRHVERVAPLFAVSALGEGALDMRIDRFLASRLTAYETVGPTARASRMAATRSPLIAAQLDRARVQLRRQFEAHFAKEVASLAPTARPGVVAAGDALTQMDNIDFFRHIRGFSRDETMSLLAPALAALLSSGDSARARRSTSA
jgi:AcrR family transcriptional regulator